MKEQDPWVHLSPARRVHDLKRDAMAFSRAVEHVLSLGREPDVTARGFPELAATGCERPSAAALAAERGDPLAEIVDPPAERVVLALLSLVQLDAVMVNLVLRQPACAAGVSQREAVDDLAEPPAEDVLVVLDRLPLVVELLAVGGGR